MPTTAATTEVFEDVEGIIRTTARRFAARYNRDADNVLSEAYELFMAAYLEKFDPSRGLSFAKYLKSFLWNRLLDKTRHYAQRAARLPLDRGALTRGVPDRRPRFDQDRIEDLLSPDAREVLRAALDNATEISGGAEGRRWLKAAMLARGFEPAQLAAAFREVRGVL